MRLVAIPLAVLVIPMLFGCQTAKNRSDVKGEEPSAEILRAFDRACTSCHGNYREPPFTGTISWEKLKSNATEIARRINPDDPPAAGRMPPPESDSLSYTMKKRMYDAIAPYATSPVPSNPTDLPLHLVRLPQGFKISVYAVARGARSLALSPNGTLFIGTGGFSDPETKVYAARDLDGDNHAEDVKIILDNMNNPNGVAFRDGALYVAERYRILRYDDVEQRLSNMPAPTVVFDRLPQHPSHSWKYIAFGPDGKLYVPVGAPCNICNPDADPATAGKFTRIFRMNPDGTSFEEFARGVRNTVGFTWHPETGEMWFTDNGRDSLGDNVPPDELNRAPRPGLHFGYPHCHGRNIQDPIYGPTTDCAGPSFTKPALELGPHVAALGLEFYTGTAFPARYRNQIFIAEHGSWNRSTPIGYRVTLARFLPDGGMVYEPFAEGWLQPNQRVWGRPVDVLVMPDGALLVSDDRAGVVYRIWYEP